MDGQCFVLRGSDGVGVRIPGDSALQRRSAVLTGMKDCLCGSSSSSSSSSETIFEAATVGSRAVEDLMHLLREVELSHTLEMSSERLVDALMCANYLGVTFDSSLLVKVEWLVLVHTDADTDTDTPEYTVTADKYKAREYPLALAHKWLELARLVPEVIGRLSTFSTMWSTLSLAKTAEAAAEFLAALELVIAARVATILGSLRMPPSPSDASWAAAEALMEVLVGGHRGRRGMAVPALVCSNLFRIVGACYRSSKASEVLRRLVTPAIAGATGDILDGLFAASVTHPSSVETCPDLALAVAERRDGFKNATRLTSDDVVAGAFDLWVHLHEQEQQQGVAAARLLRQVCPKMVLKLAMNKCHPLIPDVLVCCLPDATSRVKVVCEVLESTDVTPENVDVITTVLDVGCAGCPGRSMDKRRLLTLLKRNLDPVKGIWSPVDRHSVVVIERILQAVGDDVAVLDVLVDTINRIPSPVRAGRDDSDEWRGLAELLRKIFENTDKDRHCNRFRIALCAAKLRSDVLLQTLGKFDQQTLGKFDQNREKGQKRQRKN